jgi:hypothetical protein
MEMYIGKDALKSTPTHVQAYIKGRILGSIQGTIEARH